MSNAIGGGWSTYSCDISEEATKAFYEAFKGYKGKSFQPVAVATQVVAGINYSFFCNTQSIGDSAFNQGAIVNIYQPLNGDPHITQTRSFEPSAAEQLA